MLYYIRGYQSTPDSAKGTLFRQKLNTQSIDYHQGEQEDIEITECLRKITEATQNDDNTILIGSSLGGFLAAKTGLDHPNIKSLILLNPAIIPPEADTTKCKGIPHRILLEMVDHRLFKEKITADTYILIGTRDEAIPQEWTLRFAMTQEATVRFLIDDHGFTRNLTRLPELLSAILHLQL